MKTSTFTTGTKFISKIFGKDGTLLVSTEYRIYHITATRVCYTDGKKSSCGASNRKQAGHWLTVKGFEERIKAGRFEII